jgi:hypothetical protein
VGNSSGALPGCVAPATDVNIPRGTAARFQQALDATCLYEATSLALRAAMNSRASGSSRARARRPTSCWHPSTAWFTKSFDTVDLQEAKVLPARRLRRRQPSLPPGLAARPCHCARPQVPALLARLCPPPLRQRRPSAVPARAGPAGIAELDPRNGSPSWLVLKAARRVCALRGGLPPG